MNGRAFIPWNRHLRSGGSGRAGCQPAGRLLARVSLFCTQLRITPLPGLVPIHLPRAAKGFSLPAFFTTHPRDFTAYFQPVPNFLPRFPVSFPTFPRPAGAGPALALHLHPRLAFRGEGREGNAGHTWLLGRSTPSL